MNIDDFFYLLYAKKLEQSNPELYEILNHQKED